MRIFAPIFFVLFSFFSTLTHATVITYQDGESHLVAPGDSIVFADSLTTEDPQVTFGFDLAPDLHSTLRVTAPTGIDLVARITPAPDFGGGYTIASPGYSTVWAGESFDFPLWGDWWGIGAGDIWWLTIAVISEESLAVLATDFGGNLPITNLMPGNDFVLPPDTDSGNGNGVSPVPEPSSVFLMATGLLALGFVLRQKKAVL